MASFCGAQALGHKSFSSCGAGAHGNLAKPGIKPVFPELPLLSRRGSTHTTVARGTALWESLVRKPRWKDSDAGRDWGQEEKGMTEDEMAGWHH